MVGPGRDHPADKPRRGDIHFVDFGEVGGHVIRDPHPAVVVQSDRMNRTAGTVMLCPMTSRIRHDEASYVPPYLVKATRQASGLDRDGWVKCDQIFTRPSDALGTRAGRLNPETMDRVDEALRLSLDL